LWDTLTGFGTVVMETNGTGGVAASYTFGPGGALWRAGASAAFYLQDALGSTIGLTDGAGP